MMAILASLGISISTICINGENMTDGKIMAVENHPSTLYYFLCLPRLYHLRDCTRWTSCPMMAKNITKLSNNRMEENILM